MIVFDFAYLLHYTGSCGWQDLRNQSNDVGCHISRYIYIYIRMRKCVLVMMQCVALSMASFYMCLKCE